ncbi:MAG: glycosyltransferase [Cellvibrionaceae bacterium]
MKKRLLLITRNYPFKLGNSEISFVEQELPYLKRAFDVTLLPIQANREAKSITPYDLDLSLSQYYTTKNFALLAIGSLWNFKLSDYKEFFNFRTPVASIVQLLKHHIRRQIGQKWAGEFEFRNFDIVYSFWLNPVVDGILDLSPCIPIVSRAHGYDLYEERNASNIAIRQSEIVKRLDTVFTVSKHGQLYLKNKTHLTNIETAYLGVESRTTRKNFANVGDHSDRNAIDFLSISSIDGNKRVSTIFHAIRSFASLNPAHQLSWHHFGSGPGEFELRELIRNTRQENLRIVLHGQVPKESVINFLEQCRSSIFLSASLSEGLPVSMLEASSFGLPIVGTKVGGVAEVITEKTGWLISIDNFVTDFVKLFSKTSLDEIVSKSIGAIDQQRSVFDKNRNYGSFVTRLEAIASRNYVNLPAKRSS